MTIKKEVTATFIGRMRMFHNGHLQNIIKSFDSLPITHLNVLVGSSNRHVSPRNPFNFEQVKEMIEMSLLAYDANSDVEPLFDKVRIKPLFDHHTNNAWQTEVRSLAGDSNKYIVGYQKDESSYYLNIFPEWEVFQPDVYLSPKTHKVLSATDLRTAILSERLSYNQAYHEIADSVPSGVMQFIKSWLKTPDYTIMLEEFNQALKDLKDMENYKYRDHLNINCADSVVTCNGLYLLVERKHAPGRGLLALPGGHKQEDETFMNASLRELHEETKLKIGRKVMIGSLVNKELYDDPNRSYPLTRVTMAFHYDVERNYDGSMPYFKASDDASTGEGIHKGARGTGWYTGAFIKAHQHLMYDDHYEIIAKFTGL